MRDNITPEQLEDLDLRMYVHYVLFFFFISTQNPSALGKADKALVLSFWWLHLVPGTSTNLIKMETIP